MKKLTHLALAVLAVFGMAAPAVAFHDGGVAYCEGCHTMHNSKAGAKMTVNTLATGTTNPMLLQGQDASSTCLKCHGSASNPSGYKVADLTTSYGGDLTTGTAVLTSVPRGLSPGGDFGWLKADRSDMDSRGNLKKWEGRRNGHNIIAADFGFVAESTAGLATAPGGTYAANKLSCISCHDPHGRYRIEDATLATGYEVAPPALGGSVLSIGASGSYGTEPTADFAVGAYRLLAGTGYLPKSYTGGPAFANPIPLAIAPSTYNDPAVGESAGQIVVAYGGGMSEWCANCHAGLHNDAYPTTLRHPAGQVLGSVQADIYNAYVKSGDLSGTDLYSSLIPIETGENMQALIAHVVDGGSGITPIVADSTNSKVQCLSCHRAHASAFTSMTRWDVNTEFLTVDGEWPGSDSPHAEGAYGQYALGLTQAQYETAMYKRPATQFAYFQRQLCNKCHAKD